MTDSVPAEEGDATPLGPAWRRTPVTAAVAAGVTTLVALPLFVLAVGAGPAEPVPTDGIVVVERGESQRLDGITLDRFDTSAVELDLDVAAVAWALAPAGDAVVADGIDRSGPPFAMDVDSIDLDDGRYELLVTAVAGDGGVIRRAARFEIAGDTTVAAP